MRKHNCDFETRVDGIPCQVDVTYYEPYKPATFHCPAEGGEIEFDIYDRKGYHAPWLERKLTDDDNERIFEEYENHLKNLMDDY